MTKKKLKLYHFDNYAQSLFYLENWSLKYFVFQNVFYTLIKNFIKESLNNFQFVLSNN